ncbi:enoyl-CoA hydratase/isomerase family protein [Hydrogenophaga sp. BPS33]|uniref:enoyl-CoA hydratase/isomerase family protein n=1 Tax=Hydrogenophaga sp. BPS33 TaxID=2651974 RepID=UPI0013582799|nr:enoyl-CoA hydratase/isomerase family protein [Hydrogenophaga sp. BPS33]
MTAPQITKSTDEHITTLALNAPEKLNALSLEMRDALIEALQTSFMDDACEAVVITGAGGVFSSGGDIRAPRPEAQAVARTVRLKIGRLQELVRLVCHSPKPVVAAVDGKAYGAGLSLVLACDAVVAAEGAQFCAAFGKVGFIPDAGLLYTLPRRIGGARAQHLMLSARAVDTPEALSMGLVDVVAPRAALLATATTEARRLAHIAPLAFSAIKSLGTGGCNTLEEAFAAEQRLQPLLALSHDYGEARAAFAERRKPSYRGH